MAVEMLVGLQVVDEVSYQTYRDKMTPILAVMGGGFGYDFQIAKVLKTATEAPINRVFTIHFPDQAAREAFFADETYLGIRQQYFEPAVAHTTLIAVYER